MATNIPENSPFLRTSRNFPLEDTKQCAIETNKSYIDIAQKTNMRTIGLFPTGRFVQNGETWFLSNNQRQQGLRQVYTFTSTAAINHGITVRVPGQFIRCFGNYTDGTKDYGLIYGNIGTAIAGQIVFDVTATQIEFIVGAGSPTVTSGTVILEWVSQP